MSAVPKPTRTQTLPLFVLLLAALPSGCATASLAVSPAEIPGIEASLNEDPDNGDLLIRYAAALFASDDCEAALPAARQASRAAPGNSVGALVEGQCLEAAGQYDEALAVYDQYAESHAGTSGADAVTGRAAIARRARARTLARLALQQEDSLATLTDPEALGVLPLVVSGDPTLQPLSLGIAQMITSDLALIQRFRLVERLELDAIVDELQLSSTARVDPGTAARVGRLTRAGRLLQGSLTGQQGASIDLTATVVQADGSALEPAGQRGRFDELLVLEKQLVMDVAEELGYVLSLAEQRLIMDNGTQSMAAFLAFSDGLQAEEVGDFALAAQHYVDAVRADPGFVEARGRMRTAAAVNVANNSSRSDVTTMEGDVEEATSDAEGDATAVSPLDAALMTSIIDVSGTQAEKTTLSGDTGGRGDSPWDDPSKPEAPVPPAVISAIIKFTIIIP